MSDEKDVVLNDDEEKETPGPISAVNLNPDEDEEIDTEKPEEEEKPEVDWESDDNPYKEKYGASSKEVQQNLLPKIKGFEDTSKADKAKIEELQNELATLSEKLKAEKPEAYDNHSLKRQLDTTSQQLARLIEESSLDKFITGTPIAKGYLEALRSHARANPTQSLEDIWTKYFKEGAEAKVKLAEIEAGKKKKSQPEKGKGTSTSDPSEKKIGGYTQEEFDALPVAKRREVLIKIGELKI